MYNYKEIEDIGGYGVSRSGIVVNLSNGNIIKPVIDRDGYSRVNIRVNRRTISRRVGRLVALAYVENPNKLPVVNHLDGDVTNDAHNNLEWSTISGNTIHAYETGLNTLSVAVEVTDHKTQIVKWYRSVQHLATHIGIDQKHMLAYMKNSDKYPIAGRYTITTIDVDALTANLNSENFGRTIFVYDYISGISTKYASIGVATYHTGLRSLVKLSGSLLYMLGYHIQDTPITNIPNSQFPIEILTKNRENYYAKQYTPRKGKYCVIDLLSTPPRKVLLYSRSEFNKYINEKHNIVINNTGISKIKPAKGYQSRLFLGYNIQLVNSLNDLTAWKKYTMEEVLNSRSGRRTNYPIYELKLPIGSNEIVIGTLAVIRCLANYVDCSELTNIQLAKINTAMLNRVSDGVVHVTRLNKMKI